MIDMYLGQREAGWAVDGRSCGWAPHHDPLQALEHWAQQIAQHAGRRWRKPRASLWLSAALARPFLCGPVEGLNTWREAEAYAEAMAPEASGLAGPCQVRLEAWPDPGAILATAITCELATAISAQARHLVWTSVRPWWANTLQEALRRRPTLRIIAAAEPDGLTLLAAPAPHAIPDQMAHVPFDYVTTYAPAPTSAQAVALWHRSLLSHDPPLDDALFAYLDTSDVAARTPWPAPVWGLKPVQAD